MNWLEVFKSGREFEAEIAALTEQVAQILVIPFTWEVHLRRTWWRVLFRRPLVRRYQLVEVDLDDDGRPD